MINTKMEYVKKFKTGKILLHASNNELTENFYHDDMFFKDLYLNQINGYQYIIDFNTNLVYDLGSYLMQNPLKWIIDTLNREGKMYLYPLTKKESKDLLQDLENGY